jgi:hypothetical protein
MGSRVGGAAPLRPLRIRTIRHSPFAIRYSPFFAFAIRCTSHSPFTVFPRSLLAARYSPSFPIRDSPFPIRCFSPFTIRHSQFAIRPSPRAIGRGQDTGATTQPGRVWDPPLPGPAPFSIRHPCGAAGRGAAPLRPCRFQPVTAPGFGIFSDSLAMSRQDGLRTRPYPDPTIRNSLFAIRRLSPLAARHSPSFAIRHSQFAIRPSPRAMGRRQDAGATTQPGRVWDPPLPGPGPFAIRYSRFAVFRHSPLATRDSPSFSIPRTEFVPDAGAQLCELVA